MNVPVPCSRQSILRFIKFYLSLNDTPYWYHQTLTFGSQVEDFRDAKLRLKRFLDAVQVELKKRYNVGILFLMGRQENRRVHFHVLFLFYKQLTITPVALREHLWAILWPRWQKQSVGALAQANHLKLRQKSGGLRYLLGHVTIAAERQTGQPLWAGRRNGAVIAANSHKVSAGASTQPRGGGTDPASEST